MIIVAYFNEKNIFYGDLITSIENEPFPIQIDELSISKYWFCERVLKRYNVNFLVSTKGVGLQ